MGYNMRFPVIETNWAEWNANDHRLVFGQTSSPHVFFAEAAPLPGRLGSAGIYYTQDLTVSPLALVVGSEADGISDEVNGSTAFT
jgi:hypothetical protein